MDDVDGEASRGKTVDQTAMEAQMGESVEQSNGTNDHQRVVVAQHASPIAHQDQCHHAYRRHDSKACHIHQPTMPRQNADRIKPKIACCEIEAKKESDAVTTKIVQRPKCPTIVALENIKTDQQQLKLSFGSLFHECVEHRRENVKPHVGHHEPVLISQGEAHLNVMHVERSVARKKKDSIDAPQQE